VRVEGYFLFSYFLFSYAGALALAPAIQLVRFEGYFLSHHDNRLIQLLTPSVSPPPALSEPQHLSSSSTPPNLPPSPHPRHSSPNPEPLALVPVATSMSLLSRPSSLPFLSLTPLPCSHSVTIEYLYLKKPN
jgi:hypothetical protein